MDLPHESHVSVYEHSMKSTTSMTIVKIDTDILCFCFIFCSFVYVNTRYSVVNKTERQRSKSVNKMFSKHIVCVCAGVCVQEREKQTRARSCNEYYLSIIQIHKNHDQVNTFWCMAVSTEQSFVCRWKEEQNAC